MTLLNDKNFLENIKPLVSKVMGTEHMAPLLYSLVKFIRPHRCLEIGGGLTTIYILAALKEIDELETLEKKGIESNYDTRLKNNEYYNLEKSEFILHSFDNLVHSQNSANKIIEITKKLGLEKYLKFYNDDYRNLSSRISKKEQEFDIIWCDLGGLENYLNYQNNLIPMLTEKTDSYIIFHSTLSNIHGLAFLSQLKLKMKDGYLPGFEIVSFFEAHKIKQNSCTILRKARGLSNKIYTEKA